MDKFDKLRSLSWILVGMFVVGSVILIISILFLGGWELLEYLQVTLIQAFGLAMAVTATLFFLMRLVWRLHALPMGIALIFFVLGIALFVSVSVGRLYALQYPVFVQSFGPAAGPGLPLKNIALFFRNIENFPRIADIARDPNEVPPPISISPENNLLTMLASSTAAGILVPATEEAVPEASGTIRELYLETVEVLAEVAPGITFNYWTFNSAVPGPLFRVQEGDTVEVKIHNPITSLHHHNVDLHAATGPGGGGAVSMVAPGETKVFRFKALNPGLFVYHCAAPNMAVHMAHGMYGLILVEPKAGLPKVDKEKYFY